MKNDGSTLYATAVPMELVKEGKPSEIGVFAALSSFQGRGRRCWPSRERIAARAGVHISHVSEHVHSLARKGWVRIDRRGKRQTNEYEVWRPDHKEGGASRADSASTTRAESAQSPGKETQGDAPDKGATGHQSDPPESADSSGSEHSKCAPGDDSHGEHNDCAKPEPSSSKTNSEKEAVEKGSSPVAPVDREEAGEQRGPEEDFEKLWKQLHIPPVMRTEHHRYKEILRTHHFLTIFSPQETQKILDQFAREATDSDSFVPEKGPGLFMWKFRHGQFHPDSRDFEAEDRAEELEEFENKLREQYHLIAEGEKSERVSGDTIYRFALAIHNLEHETEQDWVPYNHYWRFWVNASNGLRSLKDSAKRKIIEEFAAEKGVDDLMSAMRRREDEVSPPGSDKSGQEKEELAVGA